MRSAHFSNFSMPAGFGQSHRRRPICRCPCPDQDIQTHRLFGQRQQLVCEVDLETMKIKWNRGKISSLFIYCTMAYVYGATGWGAADVEINLRMIVAIVTRLVCCERVRWMNLKVNGKCRASEPTTELIPEFIYSIDLIRLSLSHA